MHSTLRIEQVVPLEDDDLLLIQRGNVHYSTTYGELKQQIADELGLPFVSNEQTTTNSEE